MANQLDLEEQEQLDQLKHFWQQYGNLITWLLFAIVATVAGWNAYQYWGRSQAAQSSAMFDEVQSALKANDTAKLDRALADMKDKFAATTYAQQAALLAAKSYAEAGNALAAKSALTWVIEKSTDEGYRSIAKLRLAGLHVDAKAFNEALSVLSGTFPASFEGLVSDRLGDLHALQGRRDKAKDEYQKAYRALDERSEYRPLVEFKLNSLGVDARSTVAAMPKSAASEKQP